MLFHIYYGTNYRCLSILGVYTIGDLQALILHRLNLPIHKVLGLYHSTGILGRDIPFSASLNTISHDSTINILINEFWLTNSYRGTISSFTDYLYQRMSYYPENYQPMTRALISLLRNYTSHLETVNDSRLRQNYPSSSYRQYTQQHEPSTYTTSRAHAAADATAAATASAGSATTTADRAANIAGTTATGAGAATAAGAGATASAATAAGAGATAAAATAAGAGATAAGTGSTAAARAPNPEDRERGTTRSLSGVRTAPAPLDSHRHASTAIDNATSDLYTRSRFDNLGSLAASSLTRPAEGSSNGNPFNRLPSLGSTFSSALRAEIDRLSANSRSSGSGTELASSPRPHIVAEIQQAEFQYNPETGELVQMLTGTFIAPDFEESVPITISEDEFEDIVEIADENVTHPEPDTRCPVCQVELGNAGGVAILPCDHSFHVNCIKTWLTEYSCKCPACRYDVRQCQDQTLEEETPD